MSDLTEGSSYTLGDDGAVIGAGVPTSNPGAVKQAGQTGFFIRSEKPYTLWMNHSVNGWESFQVFTSENLITDSAFAWGDDYTAFYVQSSEADHTIHAFPRTNALLVDGSPSTLPHELDTVIIGGTTSLGAIVASTDLDTPTLTDPTVTGGLVINATELSDTALKVSIPGQTDMFVVDASSSHDSRARVAIQTTNDFADGDVPYLGYARGLFHIERDNNAGQCAISVWSHGGDHSDNSGLNLCSWAANDNASSYLNLISNDGTFPTGHVPDNKQLGKLSFGGYTNNQHRLSAHITSRATEAWNYGNRLGSKIILSTTETGGNTSADHLTVSAEGIIAHCPDTQADTVAMDNSKVAMHVDEAQNKLTFTVKYSDGTVKTGTVDLA
jgi:hypothetical protein